MENLFSLAATLTNLLLTTIAARQSSDGDVVTPVTTPAPIQLVVPSDNYGNLPPVNTSFTLANGQRYDVKIGNDTHPRIYQFVKKHVTNRLSDGDTIHCETQTVPFIAKSDNASLSGEISVTVSPTTA
jgi:hypothetical protein